MPTLHVLTFSGACHDIPATVGRSAMEAIRDAGIDELAAQCGGCLACATCHVFVDDAWRERLPAMSSAEDALLDGSSHRTARSRLSCQLEMTDALDDLALEIAPGG